MLRHWAFWCALWTHSGVECLSTYSELLKDPRWQRKRLEILQRDNFTCQDCQDSSSPLHVHHRYYVARREPWNYPNSALVTLCNDCHELEESIDPKKWEIILELALSRGDGSGIEFAYLADKFCQETGITRQELLFGFEWLLHKPGQLLPIVSEAASTLNRQAFENFSK